MSVSRRRFLTHTAAGSSVLAAASLVKPVYAGSERPETVHLGLIGCGGIMNFHLRELADTGENVSIVWLCDVDPGQISRLEKHADRIQKTRPKTTSRFEEVLEDPLVDAVIIATPHHWHAPMAIRAMQHGKDVYIEKPISHVYSEGHAVIQAAEKYGRVVQQGSQMRSSPVTDRARKLLDEGIIGEVRVARAWTAEQRTLLRPVPDSAPPEGVDYDRWLGPAPKRPFNRHRFHHTWRLFRDYGNGEIGDDGIHDIDMATWGLGIDSLPVRVTARSSRMMLHGHTGDYPDNMTVTWEFPDGRLILYENYPFTSYGLHGFDNGNVFYGTEGYMVFSRRGAFSVYLGPKGKKGSAEGDVRGERGYREHRADFLRAVRSRDRQTRADPVTAHRSCALVHLGDIASRTTGRLEFDPETETVVGNDEAAELLTKTWRAPWGLPEL